MNMLNDMNLFYLFDHLSALFLNFVFCFFLIKHIFQSWFAFLI